MTSTTSLSLIFFFFFKLRASCIITHPLEAFRWIQQMSTDVRRSCVPQEAIYHTGSSTEISCFVVSVRMQIWDISFHEKSRKNKRDGNAGPLRGKLLTDIPAAASTIFFTREKVSACGKIGTLTKIMYFFSSLLCDRSRTITTKKEEKRN